MASFPNDDPNPNPNLNYTHFPPILDPNSFFDFELSDFLVFGDDENVDQTASTSPSIASSEKITGVDSGNSCSAVDSGSSTVVSSGTSTSSMQVP